MGDAKFEWFLILKGFWALFPGTGNGFGVNFEGHNDFAVRVFSSLAPAEYQSHVVVDERFLHTGQLRDENRGSGRADIVLVESKFETSGIVFFGLVDCYEGGCTRKIVDDPGRLVS